MAAAPYIIAALGTYATIQSNEDAADERRTILNQQLARDKDATDKSTQLVIDQAQKQYDPSAREKNLTDEENKISTQQQQDLKAGAGGADVGAVSTSGDAGNVSDDFLKAKADTAVSEGNRLTTLARQIAKTRSVGGLQQTEGYNNANLAGNLANIGSANSNLARASANDAGGVTPGSLGALGSLASSIGAAAASKGYGTTSGTGSLGSGITAPSSGINWGSSYAR